MAKITLHGTEINTNGTLPAIDQAAPAFELVNGDLGNISLQSYSGKKKLLNIVPSLDTPTCALSTKKFNDLANQHQDTVFLMISADLPFAMARFCKAESTENVIPLSMMRSRKFARDYGVLINDGVLAGITARAIVVIDQQDKITYTELVQEIADEPNYKAAQNALNQ